MAIRVFITGVSGYLAQTLIRGLREDTEVEWLGGNDVVAPPDTAGWHFFHMDVRSPQLADLWRTYRVNTVVHLAWIFNPTHRPELEYAVDVEGTENVLQAALAAGVEYLLYLSSHTAYGPHPDNPPAVDEDYPRRGHPGYLYARHKALVDDRILRFMETHPEVRVFMPRLPIVMGPHTRNVVTRIAELPVVFGVRGYDPPMNFLHEEDAQWLMVWSLKARPVGVYNIAAPDTIPYSGVVRLLRRRVVWLPAALLYPLTSVAWTLRLVPFPPSLLDFIRYPWVGRMKRFTEAYDFRVRHTSREALLAYARARWPARFQDAATRAEAGP